MTQGDGEVLLSEGKGTDWRIGAILLMLVLAGCEEPNIYVEPPPPTVTVAQPLIQEITDYLVFTGTTVASENVEVRARVSGVLLSMEFEPGTKVNMGDVLFRIDPREYEAALQGAEAELAAARAQLKRADIELDRAQKLYKQQAGSEADVVRWQGEQGIAKAAISAAEAHIVRANLNLGYTQVIAPNTGRAGRNLVDVGNLVGEGEATVLTDITRYDPMYVYFNLNERDLLDIMAIYRERVEEKGIDTDIDSDADVDMEVQLGLANEEGYPYTGVMDFAESGVDADTGTMQLRGTFENRGTPADLLPGLFARVRMPVATRQDMPLVAEEAIGSDQSGQYLLVVNSENVIEKRNVELGQLIDGMRVIEEGLRKDDRVVVNGVQRARPGGKVQAESTEMASLTASARKKQSETAEAANAPDTAEKPAADPDAADTGNKE